MYLPDKTIETQTEVKPDPFSLAALIAWLRTKNPDEWYRYDISPQCLLTQYFGTLGVSNMYFCRYGRGDEVLISKETHPEWFDIARGIPSDGHAIGPTDQTFGAALSRALSIAGKRE